MTTEVKEQPAKRPYVEPVFEQIELAVNTQAGALGLIDGPTDSKRAS
jgi:hypothetical protein